MSITWLIRRYEKASDKLLFYCHGIIFLNHKLRKGWISKDNWCIHLMLLNALFLPLPEYHNCIRDGDLTDDIKMVIKEAIC